jgi:hypothetical protein
MERYDAAVDDVHHCYRGLESKTKEGSRRRQWYIAEAAVAVFDEQRRCGGGLGNSSNHGASDAIAAAYAMAAASSRSGAAQRAMRDQRVALESIATAADVSPPLAVACFAPGRSSSRAA